MIDFFHGKGPLNPEELEVLLREYDRDGGRNYETHMDLSSPESPVDPTVERMINELFRTSGNLTDRLVQTIIALRSTVDSRGMAEHTGDCAIYKRLDEDFLFSGRCNCGYGIQQMRIGNSSNLYSEELKEKLKQEVEI